MTPRERFIRVLLHILSRPYRDTRRQIAEYLDCSKDIIDDCIDAIRAAGVVFDQNTRYQCAILPDHQFSELKYLLPLTQEDRAKISCVFDYRSTVPS